MNRALKLLSAVAGIAMSGALVVTPTPVLSADPDKGSQWLSIGIPADLQNGEAARLAGEGEDDKLFSMSHEIGRFSVSGGRINPSFGLAWDKATGLYGTNMAGEPDSSDISLSTGLRFDPPGWGSHSLSGRTFLLDDTAQRSSFTIRDPALPGAIAGEAESGGLPSAFDLVLEGGGLPILPDLTYRLALINPSHGSAVGESGAGFAAGVTTRFDLGHGFSISPTVEAARLTDPAGTKARERQYWSTSMLTEWRNWNLGLTYTQRDTEDPAAAAISEYQAQASVGYVFDFGLSADLGWYRFQEKDESTDQFGLRFTYPLRIGK